MLKCVCAFQIEVEFEGRGKLEYPEKNLAEQGREPTTNSTHIWRRRQDSNLGDTVGGECSHHCATLNNNSFWKGKLYCGAICLFLATPRKDSAGANPRARAGISSQQIDEKNWQTGIRCHFKADDLRTGNECPLSVSCTDY